MSSLISRTGEICPVISEKLGTNREANSELEDDPRQGINNIASMPSQALFLTLVEVNDGHKWEGHTECHFQAGLSKRSSPLNPNATHPVLYFRRSEVENCPI